MPFTVTFSTTQKAIKSSKTELQQSRIAIAEWIPGVYEQRVGEDNNERSLGALSMK